MDAKFDTGELSKLSPAERRTLISRLVALERNSAPVPASSWKWDAVLVVIVAACIILAAWTGYLAVSLPRFYRAGDWRGAWVGFDFALFCAFAAAGWTAWRRRQLLVITLAVLATLLICDAWFDVALDVRTPGFWEALTSALLVELPLAVLAILMARRLLRLTFSRIMRFEGVAGRVPPLWKIPLIGSATGTPLNRLIQARAQHKADVAAACAKDSVPGARS